VSTLAQKAFAAALLILAGLLTHANAQVSPASAGAVDAAVLEDLVLANRILVDQGVLDAFGHVSIRHPNDPNRFLLSRSLAPALVTPEDIMEFDLDANAVDQRGRTLFLERFIHGEVYKWRPDVRAVVHSHSQGVIPFGVTKAAMQAVYHNAAFLAVAVPVFDIRAVAGMTNMLISNRELGKALAQVLGDKPVALMRGHGNVVVAASLPMAVFRAVYTEVNARLQLQAIALGGPVTYLSAEEGAKADMINEQVVSRPWELWKRRVSGKRD
jgi:HCOMODA/2-hydroxy-3-carboxy-muconic semialdehyde decarboxylase